MGNKDAIANVTHDPGSTKETSQIIDVNSPSSPVRPSSSARFRGAGGGTGVGGLVRDSSVSVGPRVHSLNFLSPPMPASPPPAAETSSYYSNHYNRRCDAWRAIRLKTPKEISWQAKLEFALFKQEWRWIVVVLLAEYFNLVMHNFVYYLEGEIWGEAGPPPPLKDLGIMLFAGVFPPSAQWVVNLSLYLLVGMVLTLCLGRLLLNNVPWGGPQTMLVQEREDWEEVKTCSIPVPFVYLCKRACQVLSIALVLRVFSYMLTLEPNPAPYCHPPYWDPPNTVGEIMGRVEITGSCGDLLFSSHTLHSIVMLLTVLRHAPRLYIVCGISVCSMILVIMALLAFKNHYSHDIVTAIYTTVLLWMLIPEPTVADCDLLHIDLPPGELWGGGT